MGENEGQEGTVGDKLTDCCTGRGESPTLPADKAKSVMLNN